VKSTYPEFEVIFLPLCAQNERTLSESHISGVVRGVPNFTGKKHINYAGKELENTWKALASHRMD
jgi:hypothetical protein